MDWLHQLFPRSPEAALFLTLAIGYAIGKINFGRFQLGGVGGSLLAAVVISQVGVEIDDGVKAVMFALFIYAVGYNSGPQFFNSLNKSSVREIVLAVFLAVSALVTVVVLAKAFHLDKGLAAGLAGGALTQSAIIGTAGDAISRLPLPADQIKTLQANVAIAYAVTYVFGSLGAIIVCVNILPRFMRADLRGDAVKIEAKLRGGVVLPPGAAPAMPAIVGRAYQVREGAGRTVAELEAAADDAITFETVRRGTQSLPLKPDLRLEAGDVVVVVGRRNQVVDVAGTIGPETVAGDGATLAMQSRQAVFTRKDMNNMTIAEVKAAVDREMRRGVYIEAVTRMGRPLPVLPETVRCQGYSEPQAGSDLAALGLRAVRDGDDYVLSGSKLWTTHAHWANRMFCLVRTDATGKPQAGITFLLLDMTTAGIRVRPIITLAGEHEVNEVFFDDVRVPVSGRVGEENKGWTVAKYLLEFERGGSSAPGLQVMLDRVRDVAWEAGLLTEAAFRARLMAAEIAVTAIEIAEQRTLAALASGANPGPASSMLKAQGAEALQMVDELMLETAGFYAAADQPQARMPGSNVPPIGPDAALTAMPRYLNDRAATIYGGSNEIQRDIIARLVLGL